MSSNDEIVLTLIATASGQSESIPFPKTSTLQQVVELCQALFDIDQVGLFKDGRRLMNVQATLVSLNLLNGDVLAVQNEAHLQQRQPQQQQQSRGTAAPTASSGLDFSNLLGGGGGGGPGSTSVSASSNTALPSGGMDFSTLLGQQLQANNPRTTNPPEPVYYKNMNLNEAMGYNPHPHAFIKLLQSKEHLFKELNYLNPQLADKLRNQSLDDAVRIWREEMVSTSIQGALARTTHLQTEQEMKRRIEQNPNDIQAKEYFKEKERKKKIDIQYEQMMEEYPEAMGRVLMLYIETKINGHPIHAFCDSGAQATIMSKKVAVECGLEDYIDTRFSGMAVGVGTGKILGRIHIVQLQIGNYHFPCCVTVMDDPTSSGGQEMPFLLGLDMMKRHTCLIDLEQGVLKFRLGPGQYMETPFLHEKDLDKSRGGTKGFDAEEANKKLHEEENSDKDKDGNDMETS